MKNILVATDFSPAARCATRYGLKLALALNAKLTLVAAFENIPVPVTNDPIVLFPDDMEALVTEQLTVEAKLFATPGLSPIGVLSRKGGTTETVLAAAADSKADLIVVGMKEHEHGLHRAFGSTVTDLSKESPLPLLIVPEGSEFTPPVSIVMANDLGPTAEILIPAFLRNLAGAFHSRITVVRFMGGRAAEVIEILDYSANLRRVTGVISPLEEFPVGNHAEDRLIRFVGDHHSNLLAMPTHHRSLAERWLAGNPSRGLILKAKLPFLLLPEDRPLSTKHSD
ncbi:MAG TPA: universal stress protein [Puia sp.]|nr:universal stress protein [Puia sp.]